MLPVTVCRLFLFISLCVLEIMLSWYTNLRRTAWFFMQHSQSQLQNFSPKKELSQHCQNSVTLLPTEHRIRQKYSTPSPCCMLHTVHFPSRCVLHIPKHRLSCCYPTFTRRMNGNCLGTFGAEKFAFTPLIIQFNWLQSNSYLLTCRLESTNAYYKARTKACKLYKYTKTKR